MKSSYTAAVIFLVSIVVLFSFFKIKTTNARDYYQFWAVGKALDLIQGPTIYEQSERYRVGELLLASAKKEGASAHHLAAAEIRVKLETAGTPFLYSLFTVFSGRNYDVSYFSFRVVSVLLFAGALCFLYSYLGVSLPLVSASLILLVPMAHGFIMDMQLGNVNQLQFSLLALLFWIETESHRRGFNLLSGILMGLMVFFKPNLLFLIPLVVGSSLLKSEYRRASLQTAGIALAGLIAVLVPWILLGGICTWGDWHRGVKEMIYADNHLAGSALWKFFGVKNPSASLAAGAVLTAVILMAVRSGLRQPYLLIALAPAVQIATGRLNHKHYILLLYPLFLWFLRRQEKQESSIAYFFRCGLAVAAMIAFVERFPLTLELGAFHSALIFAAVILIVGAVVDLRGPDNKKKVAAVFLRYGDYVLRGAVFIVFAAFTVWAFNAYRNRGKCLLATLYSDKDLKGKVSTRVDPEINFYWDLYPPEPGLPSDGFSIRWEGFIEAPASGIYEFSVRSDDGTRLWIDSVECWSAWTDHTAETISKPVLLTEGRHSIVLEYFDNYGIALVELYWRRPNELKAEIIPKSVLTPFEERKTERFRPDEKNKSAVNAYPSLDPVQPPKTPWYYKAWTWRDTPDVRTNHDVWFARTKDFVRWEDNDGDPLPPPIRPGQGDKVDSVSMNGGLLNNLQCGYDAQGRPVVSYIKYDARGKTQVYNARFETSQWVVHQATEWESRMGLSGYGTLPQSDQDVAFSAVKADSSGILYQELKRSRSDAKGRPASGIWILDEKELRPTGKTYSPSAILPPAGWDRVTSRISGMIANRKDVHWWDAASGQKFITWNSMPPNRDQPRPCATQDCKEFVTSLFLYEFEPAVKTWKKTEVSKAWGGSNAAFDFAADSKIELIAFYDAERMMTLAARLQGQEKWNFIRFPNRYAGWDSHNSLQIAIDSGGGLHVSGNMHNLPLVYFLSRQPWNAWSFAPARMTGREEDKVTYPSFFKLNDGSLLFTYRNGSSGDGRTYYNRWDSENRVWLPLQGSPLFSP